MVWFGVFFFFSRRRRHTRFKCDWSSDVCSSDLNAILINGLPVPSFAQHGCQSRISRKERTIYAIPLKDIGPIRTRVPHSQSFFHEGGAVEIRSTVVKDAEPGPKTIDQVPTPLPARVQPSGWAKAFLGQESGRIYWETIPVAFRRKSFDS